MYEENNSISWTVILPLIFSFLIAVFTGLTVRNQRKQMKQSKPKITNLKHLKNGSFKLLIVNKKSPRITMDGIFYAKKSRFFYDKLSKANWNYPTEVHKVLLATTQNRTVTFIEDQREFDFSVPNFDYTATYKILVKTSGGNCLQVYTSNQGSTDS